MKLKKLEINGFKSFPEKASILFPPGISAVVGPNGCGKSNIVDALRWVMGEQSVKQLRGKAMEDVIFSGSSKRPPLNMAEVTLTLKNDNGSAPEELREFSEIMLTRRLYRSGESAFYINKQPCRLKDIRNVFLGSGLGPQSYAVIQQGRVSEMVDADPEKRRYFIEEAAGVTRFKRRKEEALSKVRSTNQNLYRITDILAEIKRQMASLKRQARKAELYQKYQNSIRKLDIRIGMEKHDGYSGRIDHTDTLIEDLQNSDLVHTSRMKQVDAAVEEIKLKRWQKDQEISEQKSRVHDIQRSLDRTETELSHSRSDVDRLKSEIDQLELDYADQERKDRDMTAEIASAEKQMAKLKEEEDRVASLLAEEQKAVRDLDSRLSVLNQELNSGKNRLMDLTAREAQYKNIHMTIVSNKESLQRRLKRIDEEAAQANTHAEECREALAGAQSHLDSFEAKIANLTGRIDESASQLDEDRKALGEQVKRTQSLELDRSKVRSQHSALKKMEENYEWYKDGVKAIMKRPGPQPGSRQSDLERLKQDGLVGMMADTIEPEPSFEVPVEAALGESLQHILVKDRKAGIGFIEYLQSHGAGRSGFIPVSGTRPLPEANQKLPDPQKLLLNHVTVKKGFESIAELLLGHVVVAGDIYEAEDIFSRNGRVQTIVTESGDVISPQGILIGGSDDKMSGILAKKQEIRQLERQLKQLDEAYRSASDAQQVLEAQVRDAEIALQQLIEQKGELLQDRTEAEKALYKASEDLKHAERHQNIICLEQEQLIGERSDLDEEMEKHTAAVSEIADDVKAAEDNVVSLTEKIGRLSLEMDRYKQSSVEYQLNLTAISARMENNSSQLRRLASFREDSRARIEQMVQSRDRKKLQLEESSHRIGEFEAAITVTYDEMKQLEQALETNETLYQQIDSELKKNDGIISDIQTQREEITQKQRLLEMERNEFAIKRDNVASRLEEQYRAPYRSLKSEHDEEGEGRYDSLEEMEEELETFKNKIARITDVNLGAIREYDQLETRYQFLCEQRDDLNEAIADLHKVIKKIDRITQERFLKTLGSVNEKLKEVFPRLFEGGTANLVLTIPDQPLESGVEFMIHPPGKKLTRMSLLSGGEKALSAIALVFSIFLIKTASFCLMDEIDAPLDDANVYRFNNLLQMIGEKSQIIMVTHNKRTMEFADRLFGITMIDKGISKIVSVNLNQPVTVQQSLAS